MCSHKGKCLCQNMSRVLLLNSEHLILTQGHGENDNIGQKHYFFCNFRKHQWKAGISHVSFVLTVEESSTDGWRLLSHPRPYNIYLLILDRTLTEWAQQNNFCNGAISFYVFSFFFKKSNLSQEFYTCELVCNFKWERQTFNASKKCQFTWLPWKKNSTKIYIYIYLRNTKEKKMQHFCNHACRATCWEKCLLTAFLNLPVEEEVSIKAKYSADYLINVSIPGKKSL